MITVRALAALAALCLCVVAPAVAIALPGAPTDGAPADTGFSANGNDATNVADESDTRVDSTQSDGTFSGSGNSEDSTISDTSDVGATTDSAPFITGIDTTDSYDDSTQTLFPSGIIDTSDTPTGDTTSSYWTSLDGAGGPSADTPQDSTTGSFPGSADDFDTPQNDNAETETYYGLDAFTDGTDTGTLEDVIGSDASDTTFMDDESAIFDGVGPSADVATDSGDSADNDVFYNYQCEFDMTWPIRGTLNRGRVRVGG